MTRYMKKKFQENLAFFDKYEGGTSHNLKMNNGFLPMRIHNRLTFEVDLRICAGIDIQKKSLQNEVTRQVCLQLFELI